MTPEKKKLLNLAIAVVIAVVLLMVVIYAGRAAGKGDSFEGMSAARLQESDDGNLQEMRMDLNSA
jgi:hypothetical protein